MNTTTKRLSAGAGTAALLLTLVAGCSSDASIEEFCTDSKAITEADALENVDTSDPAAVDKAVDEMLDQLKALDAPDEIADDWGVVTDAMDKYLTAVKDVDITSDTASEDMIEITEYLTSEKVTTANENVDAFTKENCEA